MEYEKLKRLQVSLFERMRYEQVQHDIAVKGMEVGFYTPFQVFEHYERFKALNKRYENVCEKLEGVY